MIYHAHLYIGGKPWHIMDIPYKQLELKVAFLKPDYIRKDAEIEGMLYREFIFKISPDKIPSIGEIVNIRYDLADIT